LRRLAEVGVTPGEAQVGVVLAAAGSSQPPANDAVAAVASRLARHTGWQVIPAFASATAPTVPDALATLHAAGARRAAVALWFLAPGLLPDKVTRLAQGAAPHALLAAPLGADDAVAALIAHRYDTATTRIRTPRSA
jgi:sirohydrochlorin ferrochelatase